MKSSNGNQRQSWIEGLKKGKEKTITPRYLPDQQIPYLLWLTQGLTR